MSELSSPPASRLRLVRWLDLRLVTGVLLVLLSVVLGAKVISAADKSEPVWALTRSLPAGAFLKGGDLEARPVRIEGGAERYLAADRPPTGFVLSRPVSAGELLPRSALAPPGDAKARRLVTVPVERFHFPAGLRAGEVVDVYSIPETRAGGGTGTPGPDGAVLDTAPRRVVAGVVVDGVDAALGPLGTSQAHAGVSLSVRPEEVADVVAAAHQGAIDLVRVPEGTP
jgi:hypothetical protein